jgi:hypothetical protein
MYFSVGSVTSCLISSKFQVCAKLEEVALRAVAISQFVHPAGVEIEMTLPELCGVSKDWADAESPAHEAIEPIGRRASVVAHLLDPAPDHADTEIGFEAFDYGSFQV